jgi:leader peptidase (prepilin peptidase)/N-methyltransferase
VSPAVAFAVAAIGSFVLGLVVGWPLELAIERIPRSRRPGTADRPGGPGEPAPSELPVASGRRLWVVMALTALGFLFAYLQFGFACRLAMAWWFIAVMIVIAFIDLEHMIIPNRIVLTAALVGLAASVALEPRRWWIYLVAAVGAAFFLFVLALIWRGGMGLGDVKMALLMGAVLGTLVIEALFLAFVFGAVIGIALIVTKRKTRKDKIPFGPYLALGSVVALLVGEWMLDRYLGLLD